MGDANVFEALRQVDFFRDITDEHLKLLAQIAQLVEFPADSVMFRQREPAKDIYVIASGKVSLGIFEPGLGGRQLMEIGPGDFVGWSPLVGRSQLSDTAYTLSPVTAIAIDAERALDLCKFDPEFGFKFMHGVAEVLAERLAAMRLLLIKKCGSDLPGINLESD